MALLRLFYWLNNMKPTFSPAIEQPCQFGDWQFDPTDGQLKNGDKNARLPPRLSKLLSLMLANVDVLLDRNGLVELLWAGKSVNEDALSRSIAELRSTLGDNRHNPIYIETIPKKGYRFIQPLIDKQADNQAGSTTSDTANDTTTNTTTNTTSDTTSDTTSKPTQSHHLGYVVIAACVFIAITLIALFDFSALSTPSASSDPATKIQKALLAATRVTTDKALESQPQLSHQGDKIAFMVRQDKMLTVKIVDLGGTLLYEIKDPDQHLFSATFAPDDQSLLIAGLSVGKCTIYHYHLPTLQKEPLGECAAPNLSGIFGWSPDGTAFAYVADSQILVSDENPIETAIWTYQFKTGQHQQITKPTALHVFDSLPQYSPDGQHLAFSRGTQSVRNIHAFEMTDNITPVGQAKAITKERGFITGFSWLKGSRRLVFDSNVSGDRNLWLVDIKDGQQQLLGARDARYPSLSQNNHRLVFQEVKYNANIWSIKLDDNNSQPDKMIESIKYNNFPAFSPNGEQVAFISNRQGKAAVWLYSLKNQQQSKLLAIPKLDIITPNWSADGNKLLLSSRGPDGYRCYQLELKSGQYQPLMAIPQAHYGCTYSDQGDIFAVSKEPGEPSILLRLTTGGTLHQLTDHSVSRAKTTHFGRLIYSLDNKDGLYSMDFDGQNKQTLMADFNRRLDGHWVVQGDFLYYPKSSKTPDEHGIWRRHLITHKEQRVTAELPSAIGLTLSVNADHSQLIFSQTDNRQADIYLADMATLTKAK